MAGRAIDDLTSVIVDDLHIRWTDRPSRPSEANAPLDVDADTDSCAVGSQCFQPIAGQSRKLGETHGRLKDLQALVRLSTERTKLTDRYSGREPFRPLVAVAQDHP